MEHQHHMKAQPHSNSLRCFDYFTQGFVLGASNDAVTEEQREAHSVMSSVYRLTLKFELQCLGAEQLLLEPKDSKDSCSDMKLSSTRLHFPPVCKQPAACQRL